MAGKYDQEGPVPFVDDIIAVLSKEGLHEGVGFYPGCGNGRNLVPLLDAGLNIHANDISDVAIRQLQARRSDVKVEVGDFMSHTATMPYDYLLSIQLFQHVNEHGPGLLFDKVNELLRPKGLFALRVNATRTQVLEDHSAVDHSPGGGFTIQYQSGPKDGQYIHFYTAEEIHALTRESFDVVMPLREVFMPRDDGTYWAQWETILRKR